MNPIILCKAISALRPGAKFSALGTDPTLADVDWQDDVLVKPTQQELDAQLATMTSDTQRQAALDAQIAGFSFGPTSPKTVAELKTMDWAAYSAWFDANFTTQAALVALLKRLMLVIIRRCL